jgi:Tfp pilus assembly protein PilX
VERASKRLHSDKGVALIIAVMSMMLMAGLGGALVLTTMTESGISAAYVDGVEAFYAADAAIERGLAELRVAPDWGTVMGVRFDGPADLMMSVSPPASQIRVVLSVLPAPAPVAEQGAVLLRGQASSPRGVSRTVEATVARTDEVDSPGFRVVAWREVR